MILPIDKIRSISLTSVLGKIFENIINKRLSKLCEELKWISNFQNGFRKTRQTINNLLIIQQKIHTAFKKKEVLIAVFLDLKKAYDCVNRRILYNELIKLGINGKSWISFV